MYVPLRPMVLPLEGEELVDGLQRFPIRRGDLHLPPARQLLVRVADVLLLLRHHRSAWHLLRMYKAGDAEVSGVESGGYLLQVLADGRHAGRVLHSALQLDAPTVGQCIETVCRRVLVYPHGDPATLLDFRELGV
jgi:hypothetical protein